MNTAAKSKRFGAVAAAFVLTAGLTVASAGAANAATYPDQTPVAVKVTTKPAATVKANKTIKVAGKTVAKAKVVVTYGKTKKTATKALDKDTADSKGKFSTSFKIKEKGKWYVKVVTSKAGSATKTTYYKVTVK